MLKAFSIAELIWIFAAPAIIAFCIIGLVRLWHLRRQKAHKKIINLTREVYSVATQAIAVVGILFAFLNYTTLWRLAWIPNSLVDLNKVVFPDLNGKWNGHLLSNRDQNEGAKIVDCPWWNENNRKRSCYPLDMTVVMDLFEITVTANLGDARSTSKGVSLKRDGSTYQLTYLFERRGPDEISFKGAAELVFDPDVQQLDGHYWTDRNWRDQMQTAGHVRVARARLSESPQAAH